MLLLFNWSRKECHVKFLDQMAKVQFNFLSELFCQKFLLVSEGMFEDQPAVNRDWVCLLAFQWFHSTCERRCTLIATSCMDIYSRRSPHREATDMNTVKGTNSQLVDTKEFLSTSNGYTERTMGLDTLYQSSCCSRTNSARYSSNIREAVLASCFFIWIFNVICAA